MTMWSYVGGKWCRTHRNRVEREGENDKKNTLYKRPDKNRWYKILEDLIQMRRNIACANILFQQ